MSTARNPEARSVNTWFPAKKDKSFRENFSFFTKDFFSLAIIINIKNRNFPKTQTYGKFPRYPDIWQISKILKLHHHQIPT